MKNLIDTQQKLLLDLLKSGKFYVLKLSAVADMIGASYAQGVVNKLKQLESKGLIRFSGTYGKYERKKYEVLDNPINDVVYLPLLGFAQCGNYGSGMPIDEVTNEKLAFPTIELPLKSSHDLSRYAFVRAKGKSMEPKIYEGDLLLIRMQQDYNEGEMVLLIHNNRPKVKKIRSVGQQKLLMSINQEDSSDVEVVPTDEIQIIGIVKKIISNL